MFNFKNLDKLELFFNTSVYEQNKLLEKKMSVKIIIAAFIAGFIAKLYDDITDIGIFPWLNNVYYLEFLKGTEQILLTIIMLLVDPIYYIITVMGNLLNFLVNRKAFEAPYERSLLFTFLIPMLFINFSKSNIKYIDVAISVAGIFFMGIEPILYKEEFSLKKILFRLINVIIITIILIYNPLINSGVQCSMLFAIGYFSLSIFVQIYKLYINPSIQVTEKLETQNNINEIINSIICDNNNSLNDNAEGTSNVITNNNDSSNNDSSNNELNADDACNIEKNEDANIADSNYTDRKENHERTV